MAGKSSKQRMVENELIFRQANEQVIEGLANFREDAKADGHHAIAHTVDAPLHFFCECSDEQCHERIIMKPSQYEELHKSKKHFVLVPGHEIPEVEITVLEEKEFFVVKKYQIPSSAPKGLQVTDADNT